MVYCDAMREYDFAYKRGLKLAEGSKIDAAVAELEQAYTHWRKAMANNDYDVGARRHLRASGNVRIAPYRAGGPLQQDAGKSRSPRRPNMRCRLCNSSR